jgi:ribosomal protein S18 acetylase RimI-like enzyme
MNLNIDNKELRLATRKDKSLIKKILGESFKNDPCIQWLIEPSKNKHRLDVIMDYTIDETFENGCIYLSNENQGVVLWRNEQKEKLSFNFIKRNLSFLFKMGIKCVVRNLQNMSNSHNHFPHNQKYFYLYLIGVLPEAQGKGIASKLINPFIEISKMQNFPIFLETANKKNIEIYKKKGFEIIDTKLQNLITIFYMKRSVL